MRLKSFCGKGEGYARKNSQITANPGEGTWRYSVDVITYQEGKFPESGGQTFRPSEGWMMSGLLQL